MKRSASIWCGVAAASTLAATAAGAQTAKVAQGRASHDVVVVGCLTRQSDGHFLLIESLGLAGSSAVGEASTVGEANQEPLQWTLQTAGPYLESNLAGKVGEQVELRGHIVTAVPKGQADAEAKARKEQHTGRLEVTAMAPVAPTCP